MHNKKGGNDMNNNQIIKCKVESCMFQDSNYCTLKQIQVGYNSNNKDALKNKETLCESFKCNK